MTLRLLELPKTLRPKRKRNGAGYSVAEAARTLNISSAVMRKAIRLGDVAAVRFAGSVRIPEKEIARLRKLFEGE